MKKTIKTLVALGLCGVMNMAHAENFTIGTGSQSGTYYPYGGLLAKLWSENLPDFNMRVEVTAASVENTIKVVQDKQLVGFAMGDVVIQAQNGEKPFPRKLDVAVLTALYPNVVQFVVPADSDIHTLADLKGKKVSLGAPGSGTRVSARSILAALGVDESSMTVQSLNFSATTEALANGQIDAGVFVGSSGLGAITELALTRDIRILNFTDQDMATISKSLPAYQSVTIQPGVYNGVGEFTAPAVWNVLVVNQRMDDKLAYDMTKVIFENSKALNSALSVAKFTTVENMNQLSQVPLHPGSKKYFQEQLQHNE
ncbi:TAXI family TRAP transporter solute-binding subunit [Photobacterium ganghwense]|uniref:TAXI family TRAP transporter solute-binding subunit n=1 Tax=Photobacterium ganghwense TaxID=320778 RepID=UPI001C2D2585|nr:TAXI family TRAP transporter solute-binding subunit [Photobacterium ganghwense]MBV1839239.1 TAXI family TRAP transporter solute-binding subunit [Photobacterium ganghwense]